VRAPLAQAALAGSVAGTARNGPWPAEHAASHLAGSLAVALETAAGTVAERARLRARHGFPLSQRYSRTRRDAAEVNPGPRFPGGTTARVPQPASSLRSKISRAGRYFSLGSSAGLTYVMPQGPMP